MILLKIFVKSTDSLFKIHLTADFHHHRKFRWMHSSFRGLQPIFDIRRNFQNIITLNNKPTEVCAGQFLIFNAQEAC